MAINDRLLAPGGMPNPFGPARDAVGETGDMLQAGVDDSKKYMNSKISDVNGDRKVELEMDIETFKQFQEERKQLEAIKTSYNDEAARLATREAYNPSASHREPSRQRGERLRFEPQESGVGAVARSFRGSLRTQRRTRSLASACKCRAGSRAS